MSDFLVRALLAGVMVAAIAGPLGCLVLWRRMAFFGDALAHSALLGIALGFLLSIAPLFGVLGAVVVLALLFASLQERMSLAMDTLLSLIAHSALAVGMVVLSLMPGLRFDLNAYLFGDILAVGPSDLWVMAGATVLVMGSLALLWRSLVAVSVHPEIAAAEGISLRLSRIGFALMLAVLVAVAMRLVGVLLITALLIIPAATARRFATGPEMMALGAVLVGVSAVGAGLWGSVSYDTPTGPSIVVAALALFLAVHIVPNLKMRRRHKD